MFIDHCIYGHITITIIIIIVVLVAVVDVNGIQYKIFIYINGFVSLACPHRMQREKRDGKKESRCIEIYIYIRTCVHTGAINEFHVYSFYPSIGSLRWALILKGLFSWRQKNDTHFYFHMHFRNKCRRLGAARVFNQYTYKYI